MAYYEDGKYIIGKGEIGGKIANEKRGKNGFGFDEIFEINNGKTFAELSSEEKNEISHRKKALQDLKTKLEKYEQFEKGEYEYLINMSYEKNDVRN